MGSSLSTSRRITCSGICTHFAAAGNPLATYRLVTLVGDNLKLWQKAIRCDTCPNAKHEFKIVKEVKGKIIVYLCKACYRRIYPQHMITPNCIVSSNSEGFVEWPEQIGNCHWSRRSPSELPCMMYRQPSFCRIYKHISFVVNLLWVQWKLFSHYRGSPFLWQNTHF